MRKKIIAGNWKMNYSITQGEYFLTSIIKSIDTNEVDVVICPNYTLLSSFNDILQEQNIKNVALCAQNVAYEEKGAYTGEVSAEMLASLNIPYCIVGHSERRKYFHETDEDINKKAKMLLKYNIKPIICIGETLDQREEGKEKEIVKEQLKAALKDIEMLNVKRDIVIAYEPVWAIGTGKTATSDEAEEMCKYIRQEVGKLYDENTANNIRIQYGGSVNSKNAKELLNMDNIDGALVGGASLTNEFVSIVNYSD